MLKTNPRRLRILLAAAVTGSALTAVSAFAAEEWPMWGRTPNRNMVVPDATAATSWDVESGENILWVSQLGTQSYGNPVAANGQVWCGTNNEARYQPKFDADGGVLIAFDAKTGKYLFQNYSPKLKAGRVNDWPFQGICASPLIENNLLWYTTSRCEVICLDTSPMQANEPPKQVWKLDMMEELGVFPHNMTSAAPVAYGDLIYIITGNGVDESHKNIPSPEAPALIAINKHTGKVAWQANPVGENILHGQWASAAVAEVNGRAQVIAPLGDGWIYGYDALTGEQIWRFDSNNKDTIYPRTRNELIATPVIVDNRMYIANGQDPEHGEGPGHLWCVDITKKGDISREIEEGRGDPKPGQELLGPENSGRARKGKPNPNSGVIWDYEKHDANGDGRVRLAEKMNRTISTVAVADGLVFAPDFSGFMHCLDAKTGKHYWTYDMEAQMWGSPLVVGDKVYVGDVDGDIAVFEVSKEGGEPVEEINMGGAVYGSPIFANDTLYIMTTDKIWAIKEGAQGGHQKGARGTTEGSVSAVQ